MPGRSPARSTAAPKPPAPAPTGPSGQEPKASLQVGELAPDFSLPGDDGQQHALAALRGKRVVLYFYPRDSTPGCTVEACDFRDRQAAFTKAGVTVLGVSGDDLKSHARFRGKQALNFPLLSDPDHAVARAHMRGFGGVVSFLVRGDEHATSRFVDRCQLPRIGPSLGGVESLIEQPALMSFYELSSEQRLAVGIRDNLVRLSLGIEDPEDLLADLARALAD